MFIKIRDDQVLNSDLVADASRWGPTPTEEVAETQLPPVLA